MRKEKKGENCEKKKQRRENNEKWKGGELWNMNKKNRTIESEEKGENCEKLPKYQRKENNEEWTKGGNLSKPFRNFPLCVLTYVAVWFIYVTIITHKT